MHKLENGRVYSTNKISNVILINFPTDNSVKVDFADKIKLKERILVKERIDEMCQTDIWIEDYRSKIMIITLYYFMNNTDIAIVNTDGLTDQSILFLEEKLTIMAKAYNKIAIVNRGIASKLDIDDKNVTDTAW